MHASEFSFNPDQTHLNKLIEVLRITRKLQAGDFFSELELQVIFFQSWSCILSEKRYKSCHGGCTFSKGKLLSILCANMYIGANMYISAAANMYILGATKYILSVNMHILCGNMYISGANM